jgi:hypothetical protein
MFAFGEVCVFLFEIMNVHVCAVRGSCLVLILKSISVLGT